MSPQETRRRSLLAAGVAGLAGLAGCSGELTGTLDDDGTATETAGGTETAGSSDGEAGPTVPSWAQWVPAAPVTSGSADGVALDIQTARSELPADTYAELNISQLASVFGIDESNMEYFCGRSPPAGDGVWVLTGTFDPDAILSTLDVDEAETDTYRGYTVVDDLAIGPDAVAVQDTRRTLDTRFGEIQGLDEAGADWELLLSEVGDGTLAGVQTGFFDDSSLSISVQASGIELDPTEGGGAVITAHLLFESETRAAEVLEENEDEIRSGATDGAETLRSLEQQGRRLVLTIETDSFEFDDGFGGEGQL